MPKEFVVDLFCGAGGTSEGVHLANCDSQVIFCVNHDSKAIESHRLNHPNAKHMIEDIRNPEVLFFLKLRVSVLRKLYPDCIITVWASLECTNHSKAKGGLSRDEDSRTLAYYMYDYIEAISPDYLMIENVVEFKIWGPLRIKEDIKNSKKGKYSSLTLDPKSKTKKVKFAMIPIREKRGIYYFDWRDKVKSYGYKYENKELNSANFGAFTSRNRYFSQFAKGNLPITWPEPTHAKNTSKALSLFDKPLKKWKAVKEVLNLHHEGLSIFNRKIPLVENTLKRIYAGLIKFVANGDDSFLKKYYSGRPAGKVTSINSPSGTITTFGSQGLVKCDFLLKYNSKNKNGTHNPPSIDEPSPVVSTQGRLGLINANFLQSYYGNGQAHDIEQPCPTVTTKDRFGKINYLMMNYSSGQKVRTVDYPAGTVVGNDKHNLVSVSPWLMPTSFDNKGNSLSEPCPTVLASRKHHYLLNPQFSNTGNSIEMPCPVIIARQDKKPLGLISCEIGEGFVIPVYDDDCETMVKIKMFMAYYGIVDIKMRMLEVEELLQIQGFPKEYKLVGNQTEKKKFIGNSVEVTTAKKLFEAHHKALVEYFENKIAA